MFLTLIAFIFTLSILVFAHEVGHFLAAKKSGIKVEEFGFGLPPRIWGKKVGETIYSLNLLPIGGFVKLFGEESDTGYGIRDTGYGTRIKEQKSISHITYHISPKYKRAFFAKSKKVRAGVVTAGVLMNVLLAIFAFWLIYLSLGIPTKTDKVKVVGVLENSPAAKAEIKVDDVIKEVEGKEIRSVEEFIKVVEENSGWEINITLDRRIGNTESLNETKALKIKEGGEDTSSIPSPGRWSPPIRRTVPLCGTSPSRCSLDEVEGLVKIKVVPRETPPEGEGPLGVVVSQVEQKFFPFWQMPFLALKESLKETFSWAAAVSGGVAHMIWQLVKSGQVPKDIAGPVGIFQVTGVVARQGIFSVLQFLGILSVNLAVINILPFPPLDGGKLLFIGAEKLFGRRYLPKIEKWVQNLGMILLLVLMLLITINDISRFLNPSRLF